MLKFKIKYRGALPTNIVLWPRVYFTKHKQDVPDWLFRHELEHCYQIKRMGVIRFYLRYLYEAIRWKHSERPLENEARAAERTPLTTKEKQWRKADEIIL